MFWRNGLRWLLVVGLLLPVLAGCGGDNDRVVVTGPGLVGIDDRPATPTPPELTVAYTLPGAPGTVIFATIPSDQPTDGDIAFDPPGTFVITQGPDTLLFGIDSLDPNRPEYRAFLDFPLDGSTGQPAIPIDAVIQSATLTVFVEFVDFAAVVPVFLDLVIYPLTGLEVADFDSVPLAFIAFDFLSTDTGRDVSINVTSLMDEAQFRGLADFQVRFVLGP